jgi:hypothetical protein
MSGLPDKETQAAFAVRVASDCDAKAASASAVRDEFLVIVRALAKRHAREDYATEIAARNTS